MSATDTEKTIQKFRPTIEMVKEIKLPTAVFDLDLIAGNCESDQSLALLAACLSGEILEVNVETSSLHSLARHGSYASGAHWSKSRGVVLSAGYDGCLLWTDRARSHTFRRIQAHGFWSWQSALSPDESMIASVTGQYLCGSYEYKPAEASEPCVKIIDVDSGVTKRSWNATPPVQAVAWSGEGRYLAVGNLMGQIQVWDVEGNTLAAEWETGEFTGWGIIKGHYYTGGIYSLKFSNTGEDLYLVGMGSTRDPAAGNGRQMWQRWNWREGKKLSETADKDSGQGLMEWLEFHPSGDWFVMVGRLQSGNWNVALFDTKSGALLHSLNTNNRVTRALFSKDGSQLFLAGMVSQGGPKEGRFRDYGRINIYEIRSELKEA